MKLSGTTNKDVAVSAALEIARDVKMCCLLSSAGCPAGLTGNPT